MYAPYNAIFYYAGRIPVLNFQKNMRAIIYSKNVMKFVTLTTVPTVATGGGEAMGW